MADSERQSDNYRKAKQRAEAKLGFYTHVIVYLAVNGLLAGINLSKSPEELWFLWPLGGWGIGLCFHALKVFASPAGSSLEERMIEHELQLQEEADEQASDKS